MKLAMLLVVLVGCTSGNRAGRCIGAFDTPKAGVEYETSGWNIAMGIIFVELVIPPVLVIANETRCPVEAKP